MAAGRRYYCTFLPYVLCALFGDQKTWLGGWISSSNFLISSDFPSCHFPALPILSILPSPSFNHFFYYNFNFKKSFSFSECSFLTVYCFMFAILFPLPLRLYITVVLIFSQHSLFLPICCFLFVLTSSTVILGHLLIFTSGALTSELGGSGLRFFITGCYGRKFGFSINTFGSFLLVRSDSLEKSILISCQNGTDLATSILELRTPKPSQMSPR